MRKLWIVLLLLLPVVAFAQQPPDFSKVQIKVSKVAGNIYVLQGTGGNIAASLGRRWRADRRYGVLPAGGQD